MNIRERMIVMPIQDGVDMLVPFVMAVHHATDKHAVCWLEWHEGAFDSSQAVRSAQPAASKNNVVERFRLLPPFGVEIDGKKHNTFRAVCDRTMGGTVAEITCDSGTLWTVLPPWEAR